jgi:hypothetical protein
MLLDVVEGGLGEGDIMSKSYTEELHIFAKLNKYFYNQRARVTSIRN